MGSEMTPNAMPSSALILAAILDLFWRRAVICHTPFLRKFNCSCDLVHDSYKLDVARELLGKKKK